MGCYAAWKSHSEFVHGHRKLFVMLVEQKIFRINTIYGSIGLSEGAVIWIFIFIFLFVISRSLYILFNFFQVSFYLKTGKSII